ncbi:M13 family metallopeptidase [Anaeromyxobacter terrae]|uniref:M13 family metallopeptidase n=1 Tax=Anaeromyxobacter terrae TaxID=2925406 RepID=UPI001F57B0E8|nr:M13 family metallopeptidase [Anaeromyxobacter sp. SG22]
MILRTALVLSLAALVACAGKKPTAQATPAATPTQTASSHAVDVAAMDPAVKPGDDFYEYANGAFMRTAEIPPDRSSTGAFLRVFQTVEARTRTIVEEAARGDAPAGSDARKIGDLYSSFMDEAGIEAKGIEPLRPTLARIAALADARALAAELGATVRADVDIFNCTNLTTARPLGVWIEQDLNEPSRNTVYLVQGGLGLPDRDYYLDASPRMAAIRTQYRAHLEKVFALAGLADPGARAERVLAFETKLAKTHGSREDAGDVQKGNHPWTLADLEQRAPGLDWGAFLRAAALDRQPRFIAWQPTALTGLAALVKSEPLGTWKDYLTARAVDRAAPLLSKAFVDESFAFYGTTLTGTPQQRARWKRGLGVVDSAIGEAVGRIYVKRHFPPEAKAEIQGMVRNLRDAFAHRIDALDWMAPATKARAKEKLAVLEVGVGYPDQWIDYGGLEIVKGDLLGDVERAQLFEYRRQLAKLGKAPDRGEWCMLPHEVNAVNLPVRNALNFPAGFMEPPFYDRGATPAAKYASIGATIGHEISHSFDDQGALFDARGKLENWWTPEDLASFQAAGQKLVQQYDGYKPFPDAAVNGKLTLGENIADLAGLAAAYDAWHGSLAGAKPPQVDGLDGDQQFFVAYAQTWQTKAREPAQRRQLLTDGHAPGRYRSLTVRNLDPWYAAFGVQPGQALYLAPAERVRVW